MDHWYLQRIPNNARFSQVERSVCEDWVVLVGHKQGTDEVGGSLSWRRLIVCSCGTAPLFRAVRRASAS